MKKRNKKYNPNKRALTEMKVKLSEQSKAEFIEHISKQSIECWFDGDEFIMPSGQGKASKGIVLYQLEVWQLKQTEIDRLEEWNSNQARSIKTYQDEDEDLKALLQKLIDDEYTTMRPSMAYEIQKALRGKRE